MTPAESAALAVVLKPFFMFALSLCVFAPAVYAVKNWLPDGALKRALLEKNSVIGWTLVILAYIAVFQYTSYLFPNGVY